MCDQYKDQQMVHRPVHEVTMPVNEQPIQQPKWEAYQPPEQTGDKSTLKKLRSERLRERYQELTDEQRQELHEKKEYTYTQTKSEEEILSPKAAKSQVIKNINEAITSVLGQEIYDLIKAVKMSEDERERTKTLHHSRGSQLVAEGKLVFKFDLVGSGFKQWRKDQNGFTGKEHLDSEEEYREKMRDLTEKMDRLVEKVEGSNVSALSEEERAQYEELKRKFKKLRSQTDTRSQYGESVEINGKKTKYVLKKKDQTGRKVSYSIAGSLGGLNVGDYSIENVNDYFLQISKQELKTIFEQWKASGQTGPDIHMLVRGHSRGGVSAILGPMRLQKWVNDTWPQYADFVKFEIIQYDPVAGATSNWGAKGEVDIHGDEKKLAKQGLAPLKHAETTVIYSLHTDKKAFFRPQSVKGAKRVILTPYRHNVGLDQLDESQVRELKTADGKVLQREEKAHRVGYTDLKTGEMYRQSGINELDTGLYILDQGNNLVKVTSYEQAQTIIDKALEGMHLQSSRHSIIKDVAKAWFDENRDVDQVEKAVALAHQETKTEREMLHTSEKRSVFLSKADSSKMTAVKQSIEELNALLAQPVTEQNARRQSEAIRVQYQDLIDHCNNYIRNRTPLTSTGRARKRMVEQVKKKCEAEIRFFDSFSQMVEQVLQTHQGEQISWDQVLAGARSVRMNKLSPEEQDQIGTLKNGEKKRFTRGEKDYTFQRENDILAESTFARKNVAARELSELLGVSGLYAQARFAETEVENAGKVQKVRGILTREDGGQPLAEVKKAASKEKVRLQYSQEALHQMELLRVMDVLMGYTGRGEDDYQVQLSKEQVSGGLERWTITGVTSVKNEKLFTDRSIDEIYQGEATLAKLFGHAKLTKTEKIFLGQLDGLSDELIDFRLGHALTEKELRFMKARIHMIQRLWRLEKQTGMENIN